MKSYLSLKGIKFLSIDVSKKHPTVVITSKNPYLSSLVKPVTTNALKVYSKISLLRVEFM